MSKTNEPNQPNQSTRVFHFRITHELYEWLEKKSEKLEISAAEIINRALIFLRSMDK